MTTLGDWIDMVRLPLQNAGFKPEFVESIPPLLMYDILMIAKDSVLYNDEDGRRLRYGKGTAEEYVLKCVEICEADSGECGLAAPTGCKIWRTKSPLPKYIGDAPSYVSISNGDIIERSAWDDMKSRSDSFLPFVSKGRYYTQRNYPEGEMLLFQFPDKITPKYVTIRLAATDVLEMAMYNCNEGIDMGSLCDILNVPFAIDPKYAVQVKILIVQLIGGYYRINPRVDRKADLQDGTKGEGI